MNKEYQPPSLQNNYENEKYVKRKYGPQIAQGMSMFLNAVEAATNAYDIFCLRRFFMEHKKGNLKEFYSISLDKKKSKWRLMIQMLDENGNVLEPTDNEQAFLKSVKKIRIKELKHYGEY